MLQFFHHINHIDMHNHDIDLADFRCFIERCNILDPISPLVEALNDAPVVIVPFTVHGLAK